MPDAMTTEVMLHRHFFENYSMTSQYKEDQDPDWASVINITPGSGFICWNNNNNNNL